MLQVRGFLLNFGVYYAAREALGLSFEWNPAVAFMARFMTVFALVIAVTKDLPDIEGDKLFGVETFATKAGVAKIAQLATGALALNYASAVVQALLLPGYRAWVMAPGHLLAGAWLLTSFKKLVPADPRSVKQYYKRIWDLFYLEYIMYPFF